MGSECCKCRSANNKPSSASSTSSYFGEPLRRGEEELVGDRYRVSENNNTVLLNLHNVTRNDAGHYTLTAKNSAGEARRAIEIKVDGAGSDVPVFLRRLTDLAVKVGTRTRFLVEIRSSSEVTVSWHRNNEQLVEGERFHFVHEGSFFCVDVAPVVMEDGGRWTCVAVGAGGRASCSSHLNVLVPKAYKAPEFLEELQALLTEQGTVSLECKVVGVPTPVLRWYKDGQEIKAGDVFALTANPDDPTSLGTYTCEAVNCMGKAYSSSRVHVVGKGSREGSLKPADSMKPVGPAPLFKQNLRDEKIKIGEKVTLACQVSVPPWPHNITWYNKEGRIEESERYHIMADGLGGYMIEISGAEAADEGEWKCVATSSLGARGISTCHVSMTYPKNYRKPRFLESLKAVLTDEGLVSFECKVVGFPTPQLRWFKDGQELKPGDVYQLTGTNSLGSYCCIARNCMGQATSTAELTVEDIQNQLNEEERLQLFSANQPPKFIVGLKSCEAKITEDFRFTVQVSVSPEPSVSWYRDDEQIEEAERYRVSHKALGTCHLDIRSLEIIDQAEWKCVAANEFGHSVTSCFLKLIIPRHFKKPRFLESLRAILSEEGAVNLECKVIGVPQPVLKWYKDGEELKPGDIHRIISGQDGTCCLGTYTCEARNCMGTVASSASLLGFEERLMKAATQHKLEQGTGHMLARNPSLSTIHEERTSQMYDTPATERSATVDERAEVSFSFDGKEVSVSLYETPDLTEEEALQVVEMYADQLSEHVSEHNVVELPPLRFVKETSNTSKLLMEAIVIDVTHDAFASAAEDDLRTDADLEEFSITDDNGQLAPPLPKDMEQDDSDLFDKLDTEFLERALAPTVPYGIGEDAVAPKRPPRRKTDSSQKAKPDGDTKGSDTSAKGGISPKEDEDRSDHFTDAVAYISEKDSYVSARGSSGDAKAYNVAAVEEKRISELQSTKSSPPELVRNTELCTKGKDEELQAAELEQDGAHRETEQTELKKKMRSIESGLGRSFEESTEERFGGELPGPKPERPARKGSKSRNEKSIESGHGASFEESGDDRTSSETSIGAPKIERRQSHKKGASADVGSIESYMKQIQEQQNVLRQEGGSGMQVATTEGIKRPTGKESRVSTEAQTEGSIMKKELEPQRPLSVEVRDSVDAEPAWKQGQLSSSDVELPSLKSAEHVKSAAERGEISLLESLTRSLQDIQEGLASVEKQVQDQSTAEPEYAKASASLSEAPNQPTEYSLAVGDRKTTVDAPYEENVSGKVLETTLQQTQEFHKSSALVEQQLDVEVREERVSEKTSVSVLDIVAQPVEQLQQDTADMPGSADSTLKDTSESREDELPKQYIQCSLQTIYQSIHELQTGIAVLRQHIAYEDVGDTTSHVDSASILETLNHPLHELRRGLAEVQQLTLLKGEMASVGQALMETFAPPIQELQEGLEALEQLMGTTPITDPPSKKALHLLVSPVDALQTGLSQIGEVFLIEIKPAKTLPANICVLERLQITLQSLQHAIEAVPGISTLQEISGTVIVHDIDELKAVTLLAQPLMEILLCLNSLEISEFKSMGHPMLTTAERDQRLDMFMGLLSELHSQLTQIEERITAGTTKHLTSQSAHVVTVQSLIMPVKNLKRNIDAMQVSVSSEYSGSKFKLLEGLEKHLKEFTESLVKIEQEAVLKVTPKETANLNSLSTAKAVMLYLENLREAIVKINEQHTSEDQEEAAVKAITRLEGLAQPLLQMSQGLVGAVQRVLLDEGNKFVPESSPSNALELVVSPLEILQKELSAVERDLATKKETEPETNKYVKTLLCPIKEFQDGIIAVARQLTEAAPATSSLSALESLLQPLQGLQLAITIVAPKEASLLILEGMAESFEALLRGVRATEKQVLAEAMNDPRKLSVTKLGALTEPLKELQKEINLMEQKIQFESEDELASESSSLYALSGLVQQLRELQGGLLLIEYFALKQDVKPLVHKAAGLLVEPILELQRRISAINQKAAWQANAVESKGFTILETLAQPLQGLQRALSVVEEQNIMILEEALIFEKVSSLAAVEKVTQSVQELHSRISTIKPLPSCEKRAKPSEFMGIVDLHKLTKALAEIHKQLVQVENHIFEASDRPISDRTFILCLEVINKPMQELTTELSKVEQALLREPGSEFDRDEFDRCTLQTLARPIKALQDSVAVMQRLTAQSTETTSVFQALAQPFQDLQDGLAMVLRHTTIDTSVEHCTQKASVSALQTLATSIEEIHSGIVVMKEQTVSEGSEHSLSEKDAASFLESAAQTLKELQKNLGQVQHQILLEKAAEYPGDIFCLTFATPLWELQRGLALIEQNALLESSEKPLSAVTMMRAIAQPVQEIYEALAQIQEQVVLEAPHTTVLDRSEISILRTLANPIHELQKTLALIEHQVVLEPNEEQLSDKRGTSVLETIADPLAELHKTLVLVEQQVFLEEGERSMSEEAGTSILETLAHPIQDLERCIAFIQHQVPLEAREVEMSDKSSVSILKTLAQPLYELQRGLLQIEEQFVMEAKEEPLSEKPELSLLKTLAEPIEQIQNSIAVIEQQVIFEAHVQPFSNVTSISVLKELARPLYELQQNLVQIEQQIVLEAKDELLPELSLSALKTMAQPIHEIQTTIALIQQQDLLEAGGEEMSERTSMTLLQTLAQPLEELEKGIAEIQQQIELETTGETFSEKSAFSVLQALAESIQEIHRDLAVIHECAVYEGGAETMSEKTDVSALQTLAKPIQELLEKIAAYQQQVPMEHCEALSENEDVSVLMKLAQPVEELQRALLQVEQHVTLEAEVGDIQMENLSLLRKLAQPIIEIQRNIALIENQAVLESDVCLVTEKGNLSLLRELATPLQELQKGIVMIEQQELLEGPLSDATNVCDLTTFASLHDASQTVGVIYVEEQQALESEADVFGALHMEEQQALESKADVLGAIHMEEQQALESEAAVLGVIHVEEQRALESQSGVAGVIHVEQQLALETKGDVGVIHVEEKRAVESEADVLGVTDVQEWRALESEAAVLGVIRVEEQRALESQSGVAGVIHVEEQLALETKGDVVGVIHVEEKQALESEADVLGVIGVTDVQEQRALESEADVLAEIHVEEQQALESKNDVLGEIHVEAQRVLESEADALGIIHVEEQRALENKADALGVIHVGDLRALESEADVLGLIRVEEQRTLESESGALGVIHVNEQRAMESNADVLGVMHVMEQRPLESETGAVGVIHVEEQPTLESESGAVGEIYLEEQRTLKSESGALGVIHVEEQHALESKADVLEMIHVEEQQAFESKADVLGVIYVEEQRASESKSGDVRAIHVEKPRALESKSDILGTIYVEEQRKLENESDAGVIHVEEKRALTTEANVLGMIHVEEQRTLEREADVLGVVHVEEHRALESESGAFGVIHVEEQQVLESESGVVGVIEVEKERVLESKGDVQGVIHVEEQQMLESESGAVRVIHVEEQRAIERKSGVVGVDDVEKERALESKHDILGVIHVDEQGTLESESGTVPLEEQRAFESKAAVLETIHVKEQQALGSESSALGVVHVEEQRSLESEVDVPGVIHREEQRAFESEYRAPGVIQAEEQQTLGSVCGALGVVHVEEQQALESESGSMGVIHVEEQQALESETDILGVVRMEKQQGLESKADVLGVIRMEEQQGLESKADVLGVIHVEEQRGLESKADILGVIHMEEQRGLESKADVLGVLHVEEQRALESKVDILGAIHVEEQGALESEVDDLGLIHVQEQRATEKEADILGAIHVEEQRALESEAYILGVIHREEQRALECKADVLGAIHVEEQRALESETDLLETIHVEEQRALESKTNILGAFHVEEQRALEREAYILGVIRGEEQQAFECEPDVLGAVYVEEQRALESEADVLGAIHVEEQQALESKPDIIDVIHVEEQRALESEDYILGVICGEEQRALESKPDVLGAIHVEEQRALESEADVLGAIHVEEQRALESKADTFGAIHVEEQRVLEREADILGMIHGEGQRALEIKPDILGAIHVEEQRTLEREAEILGVIRVEEQRAMESKTGDLRAISVEEQRALESESDVAGVINVEEHRALETKTDVLRAIHVEEQRALEREADISGVILVEEQRALEIESGAFGVIRVEEQQALESKADVPGVIRLEEQQALESEAGIFSGRMGARKLESTTVTQQEPKLNESVVQDQAPLEGNISQLTTEKYEPQVALLNHEMGQGTAIVEVLQVVKEEPLSESAKYISQEAGIEANVMEWNKKEQGETEVAQTEDKGIASSKVSGTGDSKERNVVYEKSNKEYGEKESSKQEMEDESNRRKQAEFYMGQEQATVRNSEKEQGLDERNVIDEHEITDKEKKETDRKKDDLEEYENFNKEKQKNARKEKERKESERIKEQDEAEGNDKVEAEYTRRDSEPLKSREKEPEVAESNNKQEEARQKKIELTTAENKIVTEEPLDKRQRERTEGKSGEMDKQERTEKDLKDAGLDKIDQETRQSQKKKKRDRELMKKGQEECERQKKEEEEAERKSKEQKEELSIKEQEDTKRKEEELKESDRIKEVQEEPKHEKTGDSAKGSMKKQDKAERKEKELAENESEPTCEGGKTKKEGYKSRAGGKRTTGGKMKDQENRKQDKELEEDIKESDESRQIKERAEPANKEDEIEDVESRQGSGVVQGVKGEGITLSVVGGTIDDASSREREVTVRHRKRSQQDTEDVEQETAKRRTDTMQNDNEVEWIAEGTVQKTRSFDDRPWAEENAVGRHRQYDDSLDSSDTITYSSSSSTLTPFSQHHTLARTEGTRRIVVKEKVESGPRDARKKPTFATRLTDRTAAQGSRIKLTCSVLGSPEPVVEWLRDGLPLFGESRYRTRCEDGLASLEVLNASLGDSAEFTCVARNLHGEASSSATLKVFAGFEPAPSPPIFTRAIKDSYRFSEDELILECRVRCHPPPKVTWLKDGVPLQGSHRHQQSELPDGVCRLIISSPDHTADSGQYTCVAENNVWSDQISSAVQFAGRDSYATSRRSRATSRISRDARRPHISNVLTDHAVPLGGTAALQVEVKGTPKLDVTWLKGNEPLHFLTPNVRTFEESGVYSLVLTDVTEKEAGLYTCRASNAYGHVDTSATVGIVAPGSVRGGKPAMFINRPDMDMAVALGEDISVSFRLTGDPKPKVTWMKGVRDITNSQRSLKETIDDYVRLTLKRALVSDAGTYCILAKNVYGCDRAFFTVTMRQRARSLTPSLEWNCQTASDILRDVRDSIEIARMKDVPGPVAGEPTVVDSGRNWLTLSWPKSEVRGGAPVLAYRVEAWPLGGDGGARWIEMGVCPTNTFDAFNLKAGTQYKFRVTPRNRYGWGESVTTKAAIGVGCKVELPEFTRILPGQLKALQGSTISLECEVRGDPVPRVQWYRDGMELNDPRFVAHLDGSQRCTLTIQELRDGDSGRYMCEATNRVGRVSTFARLFVVNDPKILEADHKLKRGIQEDQQAGTDMPPQFTMRLRDRRVQMTYPVRLTCQVAGCPAPEVTWSKDGDVIKEDDHHVFWTEGNFHTLEMGHTTLEDSGCYSATARNSNGAVSCPCHLVVDKGIRAYVAPEFLFELDPEHCVREGGELRLSAQVEAYPTVGVMWHRDGVRLRPSRRTVMTLNHDGTVELTLAGISRRDAGVYSCTATNEVGRAETSTRVTVQVTEAPPTADLPTVIGPEIPYSKVPLFVTKPRSTEAVEGDTVIIHCEVVGDPKPEVMWLRDWLKPDYYRDAPHFRRLGDGPQYRLEIPRAKLDFTGAYSVIARNCHGEAKAVISLQIYAKGQGKEDRMDRSSVTHGKVQTLPVIKRELKDLRCCDGDAVTLECCVQATPAPDIRWEKGGRLLPLGGDFSAEFDGATARLHINQVYPEDEGEYTCVAYNELGRAITSACLVVDVPEEKETLLSRQLSRPPGLLSAGSTPRSTPRTTPSRSKSPSEPRHRDRDGTPARYNCEDIRRHRLKAVAPKFYAVPHNRVAEEGETVRFQCAIAGHPTPWVSWDKDGVLVTPSARLTLSERDDLRILEISEVTVEDAGFYRITLENEVGRVEASARLEVIGHYGGRSRVVSAWSASPRMSPTFGRRLVGSAARVGGRLTLACDLRGSPTPASTWYRNGELVVRSSRVIPTWDGRTARLEIENLELEDAGLYTCVAENEVGRTRCSARLVVLEKDDPSQEDRRPPEFLQELPAEMVATDGDVLELQVRLEGTPPLDVVWVKDGVEIPDCEDFRYVDRGDGRFELRLADVFPQDSGTYSCEAYNEHGEAVTSSRLSVREGSPSVQFSKRPTPVLTSPGSTATFCARVHSCGGVRPRVFWTVAGRPLDCSRHKVQSDGDVHMLHIAPVELCDSGQVTCVARTGMSGEGQCVARTELTVRDDDDMYDEEGSCSLQAEDVAPAMLIRGPSDTTALRGDRVVLKATYVGTPQPVVRWLKAGHELCSGERVAITTGDGVTCLMIENMTADDSGKYVVSVENSLGADCSFASVAVEGPADPPAGRPSVSCSGNTVTVTWCSAPYDGGCMVTGYCVEMKSTQDMEWQVVTDRCHSLSYTVPGLTPAEQYVFRVRAENAHGLSEASIESEPFQMGSDEEPFRPAFEPRVVTLAPGEEFKANYEVLEELGKGRYGVVHKVVEHATGQKYAAKFIRCIKAKDREKVQEEIGIMNILRHPKLLQLAAAFESPKEVVMVMEYISGGELFERVVADDFMLTERDCILFTRQICEGVDYMHQNYVVHLDLKPENIMCHTRTSHQIKLIDFGLAQKINPDTPVRVLFGTPEFIPPEIINYEPIGVESDMWSVGVICYVLLSGLSPFMGDNDAETFANITRADYDFDDEAFDAISQDAKDFISALLVKRKEKRMTARECLQHTWLAQHDEKMSCVRLCTDKLKKFIIRRKWQLNVVLKRQTA